VLGLSGLSGRLFLTDDQHPEDYENMNSMPQAESLNKEGDVLKIMLGKA
jgi:hypothetical protein